MVKLFRYEGSACSMGRLPLPADLCEFCSQEEEEESGTHLFFTYMFMEGRWTRLSSAFFRHNISALFSGSVTSESYAGAAGSISFNSRDTSLCPGLIPILIFYNLSLDSQCDHLRRPHAHKTSTLIMAAARILVPSQTFPFQSVLLVGSSIFGIIFASVWQA